MDADPGINSIFAALQEYYGYTFDIKSEINNNSFSMILSIGLGIRFGKIISTFNIRYESGLCTIIKDDTDWEVGKSQAFYMISGTPL